MGVVVFATKQHHCQWKSDVIQVQMFTDEVMLESSVSNFSYKWPST